MAKSIVAAAVSFLLPSSASVTRYTSFIGGDNQTAGAAVTGFQLKMHLAGVASNLGLRISVNGRSTTTTFRFNINGANGNQSFTVASGATGWFDDTSNTDAIAANDLVCLAQVTGTGSGQITTVVRQFAFEGTAAATQVFATYWTAAYNQSATPIYLPAAGDSATGTEVNVSMRAPDAGVWSHLSVYQSANTLTLAAVTFRSRINAANGNQVVVVAAGATGLFEDTTNSDTVAVNDLLAVSKIGGGTGSGITTTRHIQSLFRPTNARFFWGASGALGATFVASATRYYSPFGTRPASATEADVQSKMPMAGTVNRLRMAFVGGAITATTTVRLRVNGANGTSVFTIPNAGTGFFEDATGSDSIAAGDQLAVSVVTGTVTGSVYFIEFGFNYFEAQPISLAPAKGTLEVLGYAPAIGTLLTPAAGVLEVAGLTPTITSTISLAPAKGTLEVHGLLPELIQTSTSLSQGVQYLVADAVADILMPQSIQYLISAIVPEVRLPQGVQYIVSEIVPELRIPQSVQYLVCDQVLCVTRWTQLWRIARRDGVVKRFTSLDVDFSWGGAVYESCRSLSPSASENATTLGSVGSQELKGILDDDGISDADMLAGLYDDAFVEVWLVPWEGTESPRRIAAGNTGEVSRGDYGYTMEVLGPGARLDQNALVQLYAPGCRWVFGDARCGKNIEALKMYGEVLGARTRDRFFAILNEDSSGGSTGVSGPNVEWANGRVRWTTGRNAGQVCEVKTVDFTTGLITLWVNAGFLPQASDTFDMLPGCSQGPDSCKGYDNYINYGGYPDVPGEDDVGETPDAKY